MKIIARIRSDFPTKFGIPRQSGRVEELTARVVFEPEYRVREAVKGMEDFSHIWLLWEFSQAIRENWSPTVRPPRLGGNERMGVFATRSPFRPNPVGLSCVKLEKIDLESKEEQHFLKVEIPEEWKAKIPEDKISALEGVLKEDPRPAYQKDPERIYGMPFAGMDVHFQVKEGILTVCGITEYKKSDKI